MAELGRSLIMVPEKERMERKDMKERWRDERKNKNIKGIEMDKKGSSTQS